MLRGLAAGDRPEPHPHGAGLRARAAGAETARPLRSRDRGAASWLAHDRAARTTTERPVPKRAPQPPGRALARDAAPHAPCRRCSASSLLVVFAALFLRLWALQVLAGTKYVDQASANSYRTVRVQAPRGSIVDRNGHPLVINAAATAVQLWPADLPKVYTDRYAELQRLSRLTRVPLYEIASGIKARRGDLLTPVVVRDAASEPMVAYLSEHATEFPGVTLGRAYVRHYPYHSLAAQLLGYVGEISADQLKSVGEARLPARRRARAERRRVVLRPLSPRRRRRPAAARRLARPSARLGDHDDTRETRATRCASRSTSSSRRRPRRRSSTASRSRTTTASGPRAAARSSHSTRRTGRSWRSRPRRRTSRPSSRATCRREQRTRRGVLFVKRIFAKQKPLQPLPDRARIPLRRPTLSLKGRGGRQFADRIVSISNAA